MYSGAGAWEEARSAVKFVTRIPYLGAEACEEVRGARARGAKFFLTNYVAGREGMGEGARWRRAKDTLCKGEYRWRRSQCGSERVRGRCKVFF